MSGSCGSWERASPTCSCAPTTSRCGRLCCPSTNCLMHSLLTSCRTDCFGGTRLALHVPSSSQAGKRCCYYWHQGIFILASMQQGWSARPHKQHQHGTVHKSLRIFSCANKRTLESCVCLVPVTHTAILPATMLIPRPNAILLPQRCLPANTSLSACRFGPSPPKRCSVSGWASVWPL